MEVFGSFSKIFGNLRSNSEMFRSVRVNFRNLQKSSEMLWSTLKITGSVRVNFRGLIKSSEDFGSTSERKIIRNTPREYQIGINYTALVKSESSNFLTIAKQTKERVFTRFDGENK